MPHRKCNHTITIEICIAPLTKVDSDAEQRCKYEIKLIKVNAIIMTGVAVFRLNNASKRVCWPVTFFAWRVYVPSEKNKHRWPVTMARI